MADPDNLPHASGPSGGWGSMKGMSRSYRDAKPEPTVLKSLARMNKPKGVMCVS